MPLNITLKGMPSGDTFPIQNGDIPAVIFFPTFSFGDVKNGGHFKKPKALDDHRCQRRQKTKFPAISGAGQIRVLSHFRFISHQCFLSYSFTDVLREAGPAAFL